MLQKNGNPSESSERSQGLLRRNDVLNKHWDEEKDIKEIDKYLRNIQETAAKSANLEESNQAMIVRDLFLPVISSPSRKRKH
jgi:hypothetical protein